MDTLSVQHDAAPSRKQTRATEIMRYEALDGV